MGDVKWVYTGIASPKCPAFTVSYRACDIVRSISNATGRSIAVPATRSMSR